MNVFLQFPIDFDENKIIISSLIKILKFSNKEGYNIFYSAEDIKKLIDLNEEAEIYLTSDLKILRNTLYSYRANNINFSPNEIIFLKWNLDAFSTEYSNDLSAYLASKLYEDPDFKYLLVNIENSIESCRNKLLIFRDCKYLDYPDYFIKIDFVTNFIEFKEWIQTYHIKNFSLRNSAIFQKRPEVIVKGATVYYEIATKRYWHLDTFHNYIEYEVYDDRGFHLGTADENGNFTANAKSGRNINI